MNVGDEVRVFPGRHSRYAAKTPYQGWPGTVVKAGRKYATATYVAAGSERSVEFDMETGRERDSVTSDTTRVKTPEVADRDARDRVARDVLAAYKIRLEPGHGLSLEQIEALAEVAKAFGQERD